jgi:hypothetical protein
MKTLQVRLHPRISLSDIDHEASVGAKSLEIEVRVTLPQDASPMLAYNLHAVPLFLRSEHHDASVFIDTDIHASPSSRPSCPNRRPKLS